MTTGQLVILGAIVVAALLHFIDAHDHTRRNFEFLPEMVDSVPYDPQDKNPNFADGKTLQSPPAGTVARGFLPLRAGGRALETRGEWKDLTVADQDAWNALKMPEPKKGDVERGQKVFTSVCAACHGGSGAGGAESTRRGVPPPPSLTADGAKQMSDGRLLRIIVAGQANMPSHAAQVARADRWRVIRHVRTLQGQ
ncbi:MAG: c-type cytochrome [Planctomycetota bacterium]|jgi:mono/diheme cytochrome c family protein